MNEDEAWKLIHDHRVRLTDVLVDLSEQEWRSESLCPGWTVRDVAAHLTFAEGRVPSIGAGLVALARSRGNLDEAIRDSAVRRTWPTERIIAAIRAMIGSNRHAPGVTSRETMIDILVHGQDMMLPLDRQLKINPAAAAEAANRVWLKDHFDARTKTAGFRLAATDMDWSVGAGPEVHARMEDLLLLVCGRLVVLPQLAGAGAHDLTRRFHTVSG